MFLSYIQTITQKWRMEMKTEGLIMLAVLLSWFLWINGAWADTAAYISSVPNSITHNGVLGVDYTGVVNNQAAICGRVNTPYGMTYAGYFQNHSTGGYGVYGWADAASGTTYGGYFRSNSTRGYGVYGWASATSGITSAGYFQSDSISGYGVYGFASATSGTTHGGHFQSSGTSGTGVFGLASATSGYTLGGNFQSSSTSGKGVYGFASAATGYTHGGHFTSSSTSGTGVYGIASAATGYTHGGDFTSSSTSGTGVFGYAYASSGTNYGVYGRTNSPSGYGVYSKGNMMVEGNQTVTGTKSAVVKLKNGESVTLYAVEASENWFEDFGSSRLKDGKAVVQIDPTFAETVNTDVNYHVFLTPKGDCRGLYVTNETGTSFEVRELNGGKSAIPFSYRIVAKRRGYEDKRLAKVDVDETTTVATRRGSHGK